MQYVPKKKPEKNFNITRSNYLKEFFELLFGFFFIFVGVYLALVIVFEIGIRANEKKATSYLSKISKLVIRSQGVKLEENKEETKKLQKILNQLLDSSDLNDLALKVHLVEKETENAFALAGGDIIVFRGLLNNCESENELSMILSHEIAHHEFKHYLRVASRALPLALMSMLSSSDTYQSLIRPFISITTGSFSRKQEFDSDKRALEILKNYYGHVGGSMDFFKRIKENEYSLEKFSLSRTHPVSQSRIDRIKELIKENKYRIKSLKPLAL